MTVDFNRNVFCLLGLPFDAVSEVQAEQAVHDAAGARRRYFISTPNLNFAIACAGDAGFRESVLRSDLSLADGAPIVWVARLLGAPLPERVSGSGLFERLIRHREGVALKTYLFGGDEGVAERACAMLKNDDGGVRCVGFSAPGFGSVQEMSSATTIEHINGSAADLLVVAIGARKGQAWLLHNLEQIEVPVRVYLGAALNFVARRVRRAPSWMQRSGLEWLWRIRQEPALWRRYGSDGWLFARMLVARVLPLAILLRLAAPSKSVQDLARVRLGQRPDVALLKLEGAWTRHNVAPLRERLTEALQTGLALRFDLEDASYIDTAVVGLLVLAAGAALGDTSPVVVKASTRVRRILAWSGASFLLLATEAH